MDTSRFSDRQSRFEAVEQMETQGATCDTFRVKLYGKLHFLKRLKAEYVGDIRYQEALRKEFETGYHLEHPNLVRYISLDDDRILMEYVEGETLSQRLATHPDYFTKRKNTDKFFRQLLDVVSYLHSHQVLHLDLKPDNILLTRINDDNERQRRVFGKMLRFTAFLAFPAMFGLALVAPQLIISTIGEKWLESIPLLQILCVSGAFIPLYTVYQNLFLSQGKSDVYMWLTIGQIAIMLTAVIACHSFGIKTMVIAFACVNVLWLLAWQVFASRLIGYRFTSMLRDLLPFMVIALSVMGVTWLVTLPLSNIYLLLVIRIVIAALLYALTMKLLKAKIYQECIDFITSRNKKNNI